MRTYARVMLVAVCIGCRVASPQSSGDARAYLEAKARYVKTLKTTDPSRAYDLTGMRDLEMRLRAMIGPLDIQGKASVFNPVSLIREGEGGELDAIRFGGLGNDTIILVTKRELVAAWVRGEGDTASDPLTAVARPEHFTWALNYNAAVSRYVDVGGKASLPAGVRVAQVIGHSQDNIRITPPELLVIAERGDLVFLVLAPVVTLTTPAECERFIAKGNGDWRYIAESQERAYLACFDRVVPSQPQFQRLVAEVGSIAKLVDRTRIR